MIKEELLSEMFVKGHDDGDHILAYRENLWKLRESIDDDDPTYLEINKILGIEEEWYDIWELKDLLDDAGRTDVLVGEYNKQGKQLSLQRVGSSHLDPKSSILVKKAVKALGARSVTYAPNDEGEEYVGGSSIKGEIADVMYHGTTSNYLPGLLRLGLMPGKKETNYEGISHPSAVFFSSRFDEAQQHAAHTAKKVGGDPVVIAFGVPDPALLIPDYDIDMGAGDTGCYDYICQTLRDKQSSQSNLDADSFSLSREVGIFGYKGRIPSAAISQYYILMNAQDEMGDAMFRADREQYTEATPEEAAIYVQTKEEFGYGSLEEPEFEEEEDDWNTSESILSNLRKLIKEEEDYQGGHSAPMADDGAPLWDVSSNGIYPKDVYGPNGLRWYGTGSALDRKAYAIIDKAKGLPRTPLTIYRAVPKGLKGINRGDWVTTVHDYATEHGDSALNGDYDIIELDVTARDIYTNGDSWMEWGYDPQ
tara:strand:+ start:23 stop:1456 length:1434 start_codon:yes stop_codon:yes gene_type:complete